MRDLLLCETHLMSGGEAEHQCDGHDHDHGEHKEHEQQDQKRSYDFDFSNWF